MNDLNTTIVGLMSKTDTDTDLTSYVEPMEQALWAYFTKIINPETPLEVKDAHDIRAIASETPTTGRVFKGRMTFNEGSYTYIIAFRGKGMVTAQFYDDEIRRGIVFNIFDCISVKDAFEHLEKNRHEVYSSQADKWYKQIPTGDETAIFDRIKYLQAALEESKAKLVICDDNRVIIVPNSVILASKSARQVRVDVNDGWHKYIELCPTQFKSVELRIEKTTPNTILAGPID